MGTNADQLAAAGAGVDATIAQITQMPATTDHADEGRAVGTRWDDDVAAAVPPPPPVVTGVLGGSPGTPGLVAVNKAVGPLLVVRGFGPADAVAANKIGAVLCWSDDAGNGNGSALLTAAGKAAFRAGVHAAFPDPTRPGYVIAGHEWDNKGQTQAGQAKITAVLNAILAAENADRDVPLLSVDCTTGMPFNTPGTTQHVTVPFAQTDTGADVIGPDNYDRTHWPKIKAWADQSGRPVCFPEWGIKAGAGTPGKVAAPFLACLDGDYAQFKDWALFASWFFGLQCDFTHLPSVVSHYKGMVAASAA